MTCLAVVGSQHDPSTETVPEVNHGGTAGETDDVRKRRSQSDDENLTRGHQIQAVTHHGQQRAQSLTQSLYTNGATASASAEGTSASPPQY